MNTSRRIITDGPHNLRDLGGMISKDHRKVKEGILLRSDKLSSLSDRDKKILRSMNLCCAYDLRNAHERADRPDVVIPGCEYIPLPIFPDRVEGITHERDSELNGYIRFVEAMLKDNVNWLTYENPHVINSRYADGRKSGFSISFGAPPT